MRAQDYDKVVEVFNSFPGADPTQHLIDSFPQYEAAVLSSIAAQEVQKYVKVNYKKFSNTNRVTSYYKRYTAAVERGEGPGILLNMANRSCFSPALLAKLVLERYITVQDDLSTAAPCSAPSRSQALQPTLTITCEDDASPTNGSSTLDVLASTLVPAAPVLDASSVVEQPILGEIGVSSPGVLKNIMEGVEENGEDSRFVNHTRKISPRSFQDDLAGVIRPTLRDQDSSTVSSPDDYEVNAECKTNDDVETTLPGVLADVCEEAADGNTSILTSGYTCEDESRGTRSLKKNESQVSMLSGNEATQSQKKKSAATIKSRINKMLRDTALIPDKVLSFEVHLCLVNDDVYGPFADTIKYSIGHEYEELLKRKLLEHNISYQTEEDLRALGCDKTPDTRLDVPIGVGGRVVNWIESKASFGDRENHRTYLSDQLWSYWNRFGPGLVIYWFGFIDELNNLEDKGILVRDCFPDDIVAMDPLAVKSSSLCAS
ncbi:Protein of unknown function with TPD sequence-motif [Trinorchestia longiramus]|nr:Protein of unknown function with TPD sequence-motif [Trinorchestia longiramus]